jgi:hypothetical protein
MKSLFPYFTFIVYLYLTTYISCTVVISLLLLEKNIFKNNNKNGIEQRPYPKRKHKFTESRLNEIKRKLDREAKVQKQVSAEDGGFINATSVAP